MRKLTIFIEGLEHLRFISPYLKIFENLNFEQIIISLSDLGDSFSNYKIIDKKNLNSTLINIKSDIFITTTPGIDNYYFPKSKAMPKTLRPKYIYIFHSLVSPNQMYSKNSFKGFDYIFSPNNIITRQLSYLVNSNKTKIIETGYPLLTNNYYFKKIQNDKKNILIAPSWGKHSLLQNNEIIFDLINSIDSNIYNIYLRPHPMDLEKIKKLKLENIISIDTKKDLNNLCSYDYLITDWSGIGIEYSLIKGKKSIYIDTPKKIRKNLSRKEKKETFIEDKFRNKYGFTLKEDKIYLINKLFDNKKNWQIKNDTFIRRMKYPNFDIKTIENNFLLELDV